MPFRKILRFRHRTKMIHPGKTIQHSPHSGLLTKGNLRQVGIVGIPPREVISCLNEQQVEIHDLDAKLVTNSIDGVSPHLPKVYCAILRTVVLNAVNMELDAVIIDTGPGKCDAALHTATLLADLLPVPVITTRNRDRTPLATPLCKARMDLTSKMLAITDGVKTAEPGPAPAAPCEPAAGFWGVPPRDFSILALFPDNTHIYGWTRCMEAKVPADTELEKHINPRIPTVFFRPVVLRQDRARQISGRPPPLLPVSRCGLPRGQQCQGKDRGISRVERGGRMILGDFGTSYCKFVDLSQPGEPPRMVATRELAGSTRVDIATGHNGKRFAKQYVNELVALARGGEALVHEADYLLLDCGSRDIKFVRYEEGRVKDMGWNTECGASMGFTIELLEKYYELDYTAMPTPRRTFSVTCGVLGMSHIFDAVISGTPVAEAVARFVKGIAVNAWRFAGSPARLYLSGGLCDNPVFVNSFPCEVKTLGRFVLLEGLKGYAAGYELRSGE